MKIHLLQTNMPISTTLLGSLAIAGIGILPACQMVPQSSPPPPVTLGLDQNYWGGGYPQVTMSPELVGRIVMSDPIVTRNPFSRTLTVAVPLRSDVSTDLFVEYGMLFLSADGVTQNQPTPWRGLKFGAFQRGTAERISTRSDTADWLLEIHLAR